MRRQVLPSPMSPDSFGESLSDSCSNRSSVDSLGSPQKSPPNVFEEREPIYAESTKRKRRLYAQCNDKALQSSEVNVSENQNATITVVAAHTEENNRTFYLSSPDSAVSTQWTSHFSPTAPKDPSSPSFAWPNSSDATETTKPKPQSSPPVPPKISTRPPRLGTSSLSLPLPELSFHVVLPPNQVTTQVDTNAHAVRHKSKCARSLEQCIDGAEEEVESKRSGSCGGLGDSINTPAVPSREWTSESSAMPGTAKQKHQSNANGGWQSQRELLLSPSPLIHSSEPNTSRAPVPPPPPSQKTPPVRAAFLFYAVCQDINRLIISIHML